MSATEAPRIDAERALLGALIIDGQAIGRINGLGSGHFGDERHRTIFLAVRDEHEDSGSVDLVSVGERLRANGAEVLVPYVAELAQNAPAPTNISRYAELVREQSARRAMSALGIEIADRAARGDLEDLRRDVVARLASLRGTDSTPSWPEPLDLVELSCTEPSPPVFIVPGWLPAGEVTLLAGHGGAGKSAIALHLGCCIGLGLPWHGIGTARRRVLYLSHEDRADVIHWRLARISHHLRVPLAEIAGHLRVLDASGVTAEIATDSRDGAVITGAHEWLAAEMRDYQVLIIDGASDSYGASEIVRRDVRRYIRALRRLIPSDGAVLLLAHIDKAIARGKESGDHYSGSTAWNNSVRARWALRADGDGLSLGLEKANHGKAGAEIRLRWDPQAHMHLAVESPTEGGIVGAIRDRQEREGIVAAMQACAAAGIAVPSSTSGKRTTYHVLSVQASFPEALRGESRAVHTRFWRHIEALRQCCTLRESSIRAPSRKLVGVLSLSTEEARQCANAAHA